MAVISRIEGLLNSQLTGQVAATARSLPANPPRSSERVIPELPSPRGVDATPVYRETIQHAIDIRSPERIQAMVDQLQETMSRYSAQPHEVGFRQDPVTDLVIIEIRNPEGEVLKQFPPEKVLNLHRRLDELSGIVIDRMT